MIRTTSKRRKKSTPLVAAGDKSSIEKRGKAVNFGNAAGRVEYKEIHIIERSRVTIRGQLRHYYISQISALVEERTGLAHNRAMEASLDAALAHLAGDQLDSLAGALRTSLETSVPWQQVLDGLAIGETFFFRNRIHFGMLKDSILPDLARRHREEQQLKMTIWSAGCATGEETYSIAITLHESLSDLKNWSIRLIGTDISARAVRMATQGQYRRWSLRHTDPQFEKRYFVSEGEGLQIRPWLRQMAEFRLSNLLHEVPARAIDLIFCCNVLLYFEKNHIQDVENRLFDALRPGGWLVSGPTEALKMNRRRWETHLFDGAIAYQKPVRDSRRVFYHLVPTSKLGTAKRSSECSEQDHSEAIRAIQAHRYEDAEQQLLQQIGQCPQDATARVLLGCILANRGATSGAHEQLDQALRLDPMQADAHYLKGILHLEDQRTKAAAESLRAALYCQRGHPLASMTLGHLYIQTGETEKARRTWEEALAQLEGTAADDPVSSFSDLTASGLVEILSDQIKQLSR